MKVTVITVCYNSARTIVGTLNSVAQQTHANLEHIVVDGASSDDTLALVAKHGGHVHRVISEPDRGIYDAMNKGLGAASGDLVGFLNADDLLFAHDTVAKIAAAAEESQGDAVFGDLLYVQSGDVGNVVRQWRSGTFERSRLRFGWMPPHPTFYVRREILQQLGGFDTTMHIAADYDLMLRCLMQKDFRPIYVPETLVRMRTGGASNRSLMALIRKSREDLMAIRRNRVGGVLTLACKNLRKLHQFL